MFDWIPIYKEAALRIMDYKVAQSELIVLLRDINGAEVVECLPLPSGPNSGYCRSCWKFNHNAPSGQRWTFKVISNNYVYKIIHNELEGGLQTQE